MTAGTIHIAQNRPEQGQAYLRQSIEIIERLDPGADLSSEVWHASIAAQLKLASALEAQGKTGEAIQAVEPAESMAFKAL